MNGISSGSFQFIRRNSMDQKLIKNESYVQFQLRSTYLKKFWRCHRYISLFHLKVVQVFINFFEVSFLHEQVVFVWIFKVVLEFVIFLTHDFKQLFSIVSKTIIELFCDGSMVRYSIFIQKDIFKLLSSLSNFVESNFLNGCFSFWLLSC